MSGADLLALAERVEQASGPDRTPFAATVPHRGYAQLYRHGETNRCPRCSRMHWYVGRFSVECGFCGTALMLAEVVG